MPEWLVNDLKIMFEEFQDHELLATRPDSVQAGQILGHPPRTYDAFVREVTKAWKHEAYRHRWHG